MRTKALYSYMYTYRCICIHMYTYTVFYAPPPHKRGWALVFDECQPPARRKWVGSPPPPPPPPPPSFRRRKIEMERSKQVQKCSKESTCHVFCMDFSLNPGPKIPIFSRASRAVNNSPAITWFALSLRSKSRLFYNNMCPKMSETHQKTRESHPKRQKTYIHRYKQRFFTV